jgi:cytochrome c556
MVDFDLKLASSLGASNGIEKLHEKLDQQEAEIFQLLKVTTNDLIIGRCFTRLDKITSLRASAALLVIAFQAGSKSVAALGAALYVYFSNFSEDPATAAKLRKDIDDLLAQVITDAKTVSAAEADKAKNAKLISDSEANAAKTRERTEEINMQIAEYNAIAAERQTHNWLWRVFN